MRKAKTKDRIRDAMEIRQIRQAELVEKTGIDKGQMSSYLSGKYNPKQVNLELIARALSVDEAWLMGYDVPMDGYTPESPQIVSPEIMEYYNLLNDTGKQEATKRVMELTEIPRYTEKEEKDYLAPKAAHADAVTAEELSLMQEDISNLKRPF